ncbi:MetQ/NlpA family ABC transporter substrate-binding protein [Paenibacillus rigui]|nr:MetQ/NlpA family ABC transporter substrate-binding protein [Paenibacillus rigui]
MKKVKLVIFLSLLLVVSACGSQPSTTAISSSQPAPAQVRPEDVTIKLLASTVNNNDEVAPILKTELDKLGYKLEFKTPSDTNVGNKEVLAGNYDALIGMHTAALNTYNEAQKTNLVEAFKTTFAPNGLFSRKYKSLEQLPEGATISIPSDASNAGRPLFILQSKGLIKLKPGTDPTKTSPSDIIENPHKYKFKSVDTAVLLRALDDVDAGFLYQSLRIQGGFKLTDALGLESADAKDYYIIALTRPELIGSAKLKALQQAYFSAAVKDFYVKKYDAGSIYYSW